LVHYLKAMKCYFTLSFLSDSCLPRYCILGQILEVQALDKLDIDSVYPLFKKIKDHLKHHPEDR
jgi:hypothetical protein